MGHGKLFWCSFSMTMITDHPFLSEAGALLLSGPGSDRQPWNINVAILLYGHEAQLPLHMYVSQDSDITDLPTQKATSQ